MNYTITNKHGLPDPFWHACKILSDDYSKGDAEFSVTELIGPAHLGAVRRRAERLNQEVVVDCRDMYHAVQGSAIHYFLESLDKLDDYIVERRYFSEFDGHTLSGQIDCFYTPKEGDWVITDWKQAAKRTFQDGIKFEYEAQLNLNAWLARKNHMRVDTIQIAPLYRDYAVMNPADMPTERLVAEIWSDQKCEGYLMSRIAAHVLADDLLEGDSPGCSEAEVWADPEKWRVKKLSSPSRAIKGGVHLSEESAEMCMYEQKKPHDHYIEHSPAIRKRCQAMCSFSGLCEFWQNHPTNPNKTK